MIKLRGKIIGETDKAWRLKVIDDENSTFTGKELWIPKYSSRIDEEEIRISVSESLYKKKVEHLSKGKKI